MTEKNSEEITKPYRTQQRKKNIGAAEEEQVMGALYSEPWASSWERNFEGAEKEGQAERWGQNGGKEGQNEEKKGENNEIR